MKKSNCLITAELQEMRHFDHFPVLGNLTHVNVSNQLYILRFTLICPFRRYNLPPSLEIITHNSPNNFPKLSIYLKKNFSKFSKRILKLPFSPRKFLKLGVYDIRHDRARSRFQLCDSLGFKGQISNSVVGMIRSGLDKNRHNSRYI